MFFILFLRHLPKDSFIALDDFDGPKQLANYLQHLINNPDEYMKYFQWRSKGWAFAPWNSAGYREGTYFYILIQKGKINHFLL